MINLDKLIVSKKEEIVNPIAIFSSLPNKSKKYKGYLRNVQGEVLNQWFEMRNHRDNIIKMNTGSGKTTVALLILQSSLNEKLGNAVYVVQDSYLIKQVKEEANDLGIMVTDDPDNPFFLKGKAILIISIQKLINGKTIFDERRKIDNIVIDDVHACLESAEQQFIIKIDRKVHSELYDELFSLFESELKRQNSLNALNIADKLETSNPMLVPYWEVKKNSEKIVKFINRHMSDENYSSIIFPFGFLNDIVQYCNISITYNSIEISPDCLPIYKVSAFDNAKRRIFVSATLKDDGRLINSFNVNKDSVEKVITPSQALDIGNRMILYPQALNTSITDSDIKSCLKQISINKRVIVIVPSYRRAEYWKDVASHIFDKTNIEEVKKYSIGLDVLINRYDGLDLKEDLCSYLVIDGLPNCKSLFEQIEESILNDTSKSTRNKIQQIEQGMGRGIRSNADSCAVIIFGKKMLNLIYNNSAKDNFSASTKVQFDLSEKISEQLYNSSLEDIMDAFSLCLEKNEEWLSIVSKNLSEIVVDNALHYNEDEIQLNKAFIYAIKRNYQECIKIIQELVNKTSDEKLKGYYMFYLAKYTNFINPVDSQTRMFKAKQLNNNLYLPLEGYDYVPRKENKIQQSKLILKLIDEEYHGNLKSYLYSCETIASNLNFSEVGYKVFERNIDELAKHLGFIGSRPDTEIGQGPDNLWDLGDGNYLVIECKNEATTEYISKRDCGQLLVSLNWCKEKYGNEKKYIPIMIHSSKCFDSSAIPNADTRIIAKENLQNLTTTLIEFCKTLQMSTLDEFKISELIQVYGLNKSSLVNKYSSSYTIRK